MQLDTTQQYKRATTDKCNNLEESHRHCVELKNPDTK